MDPHRSKLFLEILQGALNDYLGPADRALTVLDISTDKATTTANTHILSFRRPVNSSGRFTVPSNESLPNIYYHPPEPNISEVLSDSVVIGAPIPVSDYAVNFHNLRSDVKASLGIENFDIIIAYRFFSKLTSALSKTSGQLDEQICTDVLKALGDALVPGGLLMIGEVYVPDWLVSSAFKDQVTDSLTQHIRGLSSVKPDKLIELATYKLSEKKEGYNQLRMPLFTVRNYRSNFGKIQESSPCIASEMFLENGTREFSLALERSQKPFDDSRIVETVKQENETIFKRLESHIKLGRSAALGSNYREHLVKLLSNSDQPDDSLYAGLARCLYFQVLLEAMNGGIDLSAARMVFWMAYESGVPGCGFVPASERGSYPLFGYSFGPTHIDHFYHDEPSRKSRTRFWLNIILNAEPFVSNRDDRAPLRPPSVHEWFIQHSPRVISTVDPFDDQPLETLTVYLGDSDNRNLALVEGYNSSRRHHRIELRPLDRSNHGEYWGFQLSEELSRIESQRRNRSPYLTVPWPYEKTDVIPSVVSVAEFEAETRRLKESYESGKQLRPSMGWIRCNLYSVFLTMCLGEVMNRCTALPEWLQFYKTVLLNEGYELLVHEIDRACADTEKYLRSEKSLPLTSLTWVAPPLLVSLIEESPRPLGSILIAGSRLVPVVAFRQLKNQLLTTFIALREGEELIESEQQAKRASLLKGHARSIEGFSHEISKVANAIDQHYLIPINNVFDISQHSHEDAEHWVPAAGSISTKVPWLNNITQWRVCTTPALLRGLTDVLYMWSSSTFWWESEDLQMVQPIENILRKIREIAIRVGVTMRTGLFAGLPSSVETAERIENSILERKQYFEKLIPPISYKGPKLFWIGSEETRFAESAYIRMLVIAISNAINNMDRVARRLDVAVDSDGDEIRLQVYNSRVLEDSPEPRLEYFGSTKSALENCVRILNNGAVADTSFFFGIDSSNKSLWNTKAHALLRVNNREGDAIQWLRTSS